MIHYVSGNEKVQFVYHDAANLLLVFTQVEE